MDKNNIKKQSVYISEEERTLDWIEIQAAFKKTKSRICYIRTLVVFNVMLRSLLQPTQRVRMSNR